MSKTAIIPAGFLPGTSEFCLQAGNYYTTFHEKIDHEICCLFPEEKGDGVGWTGGNGLRGI
jgi:hypothetical protein